MSSCTVLSVAQVTDTAATNATSSSSAPLAESAISDSAPPPAQPAPSDNGALTSTLVVEKATSPSTDPSPAASTKRSTQSTPNASPSKATRGTNSRKTSKRQHAAALPQLRMTTCSMRLAEELQQALIESETAQSQSSTASRLPLFVVTFSAPTSQEPLQVHMVEEDAPHKTPYVANAQVASASTDE